MTSVIFISSHRSKQSKTRQRVFSLGRAYIGSPCNHELIDLFLKRLSKTKWALQTYVDWRVIELATYSGDQHLEVLRDYEFCEPTTAEDLISCGWQPSADVYDIVSGELLE